MRDYQKELDALRQRIAQRREYIATLERLTWQEEELRNTVADRQSQLDQEQRDVDRLERVSLSSIWASLRGTKEEDIDREKAEAWAARLKLQEAERQLEEIQAEIADRRERIWADEDCQAQYEALLREKDAEYRAKDPAFAQKMAHLEQRELEATSLCRELKEAVDAGNRALTQIEAALVKLDDAEGWSTWDMMGGGLLADVMKYSSMDEAQQLMEGVQSDLRRYQAELADVAQEAEFNLRQDGFTQTMDIWFDNIFSDWAVRDSIQQSCSQLRGVEDRVRRIQYGLERELDEAERQLEALRKEREETVRQA